MIDKSKPYGTKKLTTNRLASIFQKGLGVRPYVALCWAKNFLKKNDCQPENLSNVSVAYTDDGDIMVQYTENGVNITSIL
jgi:hypothetical protein